MDRGGSTRRGGRESRHEENLNQVNDMLSKLENNEKSDDSYSHQNRSIGDKSYLDRVKTESGTTLNQNVDGENISLEEIRNLRKNRNSRNSEEDMPPSKIRRQEVERNEDRDFGNERQRKSINNDNGNPYSNSGNKGKSEDISDKILSGLIGIVSVLGIAKLPPIQNLLDNLGLNKNKETGDVGRKGRRGVEETNQPQRFSFFKFIAGSTTLVILIFIVLVVFKLNSNFNPNTTEGEIINKLDKFIESTSGGSKDGKMFKGKINENYEIDLIRILKDNPQIVFDENDLAKINLSLLVTKIDKKTVNVNIGKQNRTIPYNIKEDGYYNCELTIDRDGNIFDVEIKMEDK